MTKQAFQFPGVKHWGDHKRSTAVKTPASGYNNMGFGFLESVYEKCMLIELQKAGLTAESQKPIVVHYEDEIVGEFKADIIVNNTIILELKSVRRIIKAHEVQLVNYLVATGKPVGLIINFGEKKTQPTTSTLFRPCDCICDLCKSLLRSYDLHH